MCEPVSITSAILAIVGTTTAYVQSENQANANAKFQNTMYERSGQNALTNFLQQTSVSSQRLMQNNTAAGVQQQTNARQAVEAQAHALTAAGEAGVDGNSVNALFQDFQQISARNSDAIHQNLQWGTQQTMQDEQSLQAAARNHIAMAMPGPIQFPSLAGSLLEGGSQMVSIYDKYQRNTQQGIYNPNNRPSGNNSAYSQVRISG